MLPEFYPGQNEVLANFSDAVNQIEEENRKKAIIQTIEYRKGELHSHLKKWLADVMSAREANYHTRWNRWRRNSRNIYDPQKKARKEGWQSTLFVPLSMMHKEILKGHLRMLKIH